MRTSSKREESQDLKKTELHPLCAAKEVVAWRRGEALRQDIQAGIDSGPAGELNIEPIKRRGLKHLATLKNR